MSDRHDHENFFQALGETFGGGPAHTLGVPQNFRTVVPVVYRARPGDTLASIAKKFRVGQARYGELLLANPTIHRVRLPNGLWAFAVGALPAGTPVRIPKSWLVRAKRHTITPRRPAGSRARLFGMPTALGEGSDGCDPGYWDPSGMGACIYDPNSSHWDTTGGGDTGTGGTTSGSCGANQVDDGNGGCTCEAGYQPDGSGGCTPIAQTGGQALVCAGGGGTWHNDTAFCECPSGQTWNPDTSSCETPSPTDIAGQCNAAGGVWNGQWCECNPGNRFQNGACVPVSQNDCTAGQTYDENGPQGPNCYWCGQNTVGDDGTSWDPASHSCVCASGMTWNDAQKKCVGGGGGIVQPPPPPQIQCPAGQTSVNGVCTSPPPPPEQGASKASIGLWIALLVGLGYGAYEIAKYLSAKGHSPSSYQHLLPKALRSHGRTRRSRAHR